jgi:protein O-mannosyl-transferase
MPATSPAPVSAPAQPVALPASGGSPAPVGRRPWLRYGLLGLLLVAAIVLAYQPAWNAGFIWDDDDYVTENPLLPAPDGLQRIWFSQDSPSQYFPLTYTTFRFQYALWGLNPVGYHWFNILLHSLNALLVWRLLSRLHLPAAWLAAGIFALHPVQVESVAWVTELKNVQSLFFSLLCLLAWVSYLERGRRRHYGAAFAWFALALFSKTTACTLPLALLLVLWLRHSPITRQRLVALVPFVIWGLVMGLVSVWWERTHQGTVGDDYGYSFLERLLIATRAIWFYLGKFLWPVDLTFSYPLWSINASDPRAYAWLVGGLMLVGAVLWGRRRWGRGLEAAVVFYVGTLGPLLGFFMLYTFCYTFVADHYQYVALIAPAALAAAVISRLARGSSGRSPVRAVATVIVLGVLATLTWRQSRMYQDLETLWGTTIARNPSSYMAHNNLGAVYLEQGRLLEAIARFERSLELRPQHDKARGNLASALLQLGQPAQAKEHLLQVLAVQPNDVKAHSDLALVHLQLGQPAEALGWARRALELHPGNADALSNLASAHLQLGNIDEALHHYQQVLQQRPAHAPDHFNLGTALLHAGAIPAAVDSFRQALTLRPDYVAAHGNAAFALLQLGESEEAIAHLQVAAAFAPGDLEVRNNLGWVLLQTGRPTEAIEQFQMVLTAAPHATLVRHNLALAHLHRHEPSAAVLEYRRLIEEQPDDPRLLSALAWILATWPDAGVRDPVTALALANRAHLLTDGTDPLSLQALAAAYAEAGRFAEAVDAVETALALDHPLQPQLAPVLTSQLTHYRQGTAYREAPSTTR